MINGISEIEYMVVGDQDISNFIKDGQAEGLIHNLNPEIPMVYVDREGEIYLLISKTESTIEDPYSLLCYLQSSGTTRIENALNYRKLPKDETLGAIIHRDYESDFLRATSNMGYDAKKVNAAVLE